MLQAIDGYVMFGKMLVCTEVPPDKVAMSSLTLNTEIPPDKVTMSSLTLNLHYPTP